MAVFKPIRVQSSAVENIPVVDGQLIVVSDTGRVYMDINNTRVAVGIPSMWGSTNQGKYLCIQEDGTIGSCSLPVYDGSVSIINETE